MSFTDILSSKELSGFSGASVFLATKDNKTWFVRKIASDVENSARLKIQVEKQALFSSSPPFHTPKILATGTHNDLFYVDQEYIKGNDAVNYLRAADYKQVSKFLEHIKEYIDVASQEEAPSKDQILGLKTKVLNIASNCALNTKLISKITDKIDHLNQSFYIGNTNNHGDFTLENMIIDRNGKIYLFDFLNSQFNHYWQDVSKLYQDLLGGWYLRKEENIAKSTTDFLSKEIYDYTIKINPTYEQFHNLLICYNFLRILPYSKSEENTKLVMSRIKYFAERL